MIVAFNLAGFFAAHAIWSIADQESLVPMFAHINEDGEKQLQRLVIGGDLENRWPSERTRLKRTSPH